MKFLFPNTGLGQRREIWPVLLVLMVVVLVPTACVLWFMNLAVRNERLAMRQKLEDLYRGHLLGARAVVNEHWDSQLSAVEQLSNGLSPSRTFEEISMRGLADAALCFDSAGVLVYPSPTSTLAESEPDKDWLAAERLEYIDVDLPAAADAYGRLAQTAANINIAARALQAQARCLARAGLREQAIKIITEDLGIERFRAAVDLQGRSIVADASLMALRMMHGHNDPRMAETVSKCKGLVADYSNSALPSSQRRFLMHELQSLLPELDFPTVAAEDLAARIVENEISLSAKNGFSNLPDVWQVWTLNRRVLLIFAKSTLLDQINSRLAEILLPEGAVLDLLPPGAGQAGLERPFSIAGGELPDWQITLAISADDALDTAADEQIASYLWTGLIFVAAICVVAVLLGWALSQQIRLTRLKNDLVATVSHELKTPLSSMRLLVDTLLDAGRLDEARTREYLALIAAENSRLSRLIDNFLAFSRLDRKKYALELDRISPVSIVMAAVEAAGDRFTGPACRLEVKAGEELPKLWGDHDALVTALLNLLDNAYKYSGEQKRIQLRAYSGPGVVCFAVSDNGIGLAPRTAKRVFQKFYQVNRSLSRTSGGCGLGLSIVQFIAISHGGSVSVSSQLGQGSTFTIRVPVLRAVEPAAKEARAQ